MAMKEMQAAEDTLHDVIKARPQMSQFLPPEVKPPQQRIAESSATAMISLDALRTDSKARIFSFLNYTAGAAKTAADVPVLVKTPDEAQKYCQDLYDLYTRMAAAKAGLPPAPPGWRAPDVFTKPMQSAEFTETYKRNEMIGRNVADNYLSAQYLGPWVGPSFRDKPPVVVTVPEEHFKAFQKAFETNGQPLGMYMNGTNIILISDKLTDPVTRLEVILHESLHYAAYLGSGGHQARYTQSSGTQGTLPLGGINEALVQFHTKELLERSKFHIVTTAYGPETVMISYLQKIVGDEPLRRAFMSGDFTEVRNTMNSRLKPPPEVDMAGRSTFGKMLSFSDGVDALAFIRRTLHANGVDHATWDQEPIVRSTGVV